MAKSQRLRLRDLRSIYRLIGECRDLGADWHQWRAHALEGLRQLTGAQAAAGGEVQGFLTDGPKQIDLMSLGWADNVGRTMWAKFIRGEAPTADPMYERMLETLGRRGGLVTHTLHELIEERQWRRSEHFNEYRLPGRVDGCLYSYFSLPSAGKDVIDVIELYGALGNRPFDQRERRLVLYFHHELAQLVGRQLAAAGDPSLSTLPPRLQDVLMRLLEGDSEKQVAVGLGLGRSTIHEYVTALYRRFGVSSRGELMAHWIRFGQPQENRTTVGHNRLINGDGQRAATASPADHRVTVHLPVTSSDSK